VSEELWLDDRSSGPATRPGRRRIAIGFAAAVCLLVAAVPTFLIVSGGNSRASDANGQQRPPVAHAKSGHQVLSALNATTASGNFDVTYTFGGQAGGTGSTTTTTCGDSHPESGLEICSGLATMGDEPVTGTATIDLQPFSMVASSQVSGLGTVVLRDNGTDVWEEGGGDYGLSPGSDDSGPGSSLTGFSRLVEGTLGPRQGALAMLGLASPSGYLNLDPAETTGASVVGTDTVQGVPVTVYQIPLAPGQGGVVPGITPQEQQAEADALDVLSDQGFMGSTVRISVDAAGFIRRTQTVDHFADGTTMTSEAEFSNFGCAGTVLMPGQAGSPASPAGCTSPDNPTSTTTTTSLASVAGSTPSTPSSATAPRASSSTVAPPPSTTTTVSTRSPSSSVPSRPTTTTVGPTSSTTP
jgi:hypothetical protein